MKHLSIYSLLIVTLLTSCQNDETSLPSLDSKRIDKTEVAKYLATSFPNANFSLEKIDVIEDKGITISRK